MSFIRSGTGVIDKDRGITVKMAFGHFDDTDTVTYEYIEDAHQGKDGGDKLGRLSFMFKTKAETRRIEVVDAQGKAWPQTATVTTFIIESSIESGLIDALGPIELKKVDLNRIKATIKEAVFVSEASEEYLRLVPDFKVAFS